VVAANGLGGYGGKLDGYLCEIKSILLRHEKNDCDNQRHKK
jgi:O6-methylguanine-DNA--protein-cysteine methyltransferase